MKTGFLWTSFVVLAFVSFFLGVSVDGAWGDSHHANGSLLLGSVVVGLVSLASLVALIFKNRQ